MNKKFSLFCYNMKFDFQGLGRNRCKAICRELNFENLRWTVFTLGLMALCYLLMYYLRAGIAGGSFIGISEKIWYSLDPCKCKDNAIK